MLKGKNFLWLMLATIVIAVAIWLFLPNYYTISASAIKQGGDGRLTGTFRIDRVVSLTYKPGWPFVLRNGLYSQRTGGACLVAHPRDVGALPLIGKACTRNSDCKPTGIAGASGYCDVSTRQCWVRPGPPSPGLCNRSIDYQPKRQWAEGKHHSANRQRLAWTVPPGQASVRWRVLACLNGYDDATQADSGACGTEDGANRMEVMGPVTAFP